MQKIKGLALDGKNVKLQIWDTAGQERFRTITQTYYKGAMGILLTYDCTDEGSFSSIRNWTQQIKLHASAQVAKVLIGNKCDRPDRKITREQGEALARELEMPFFEASAKNNINVQEAFAHIAKDIKDKRMADPMGVAATVRVGDTKKPGRKKCCK